MARLETVDSLRISGATLTVLREGDDLKDFTPEMLADMRVGAEGRMSRALDYTVDRVRWMLSAVYPAHGASGTVRQSSPPGAPPGMIEGDLHDSWKKGRITWGRGKLVLTGRYFSRHPSAGALEWGSPPKPQWPKGLPSRPYIRPMLVRFGDRIAAILDGSE
jgi:hypothetical protein